MEAIRGLGRSLWVHLWDRLRAKRWANYQPPRPIEADVVWVQPSVGFTPLVHFRNRCCDVKRDAQTNLGVQFGRERPQRVLEHSRHDDVALLALQPGLIIRKRPPLGKACCSLYQRTTTQKNVSQAFRAFATPMIHPPHITGELFDQGVFAAFFLSHGGKVPGAGQKCPPLVATEDAHSIEWTGDPR
jgi:hypothetical protein